MQTHQCLRCIHRQSLDVEHMSWSIFHFTQINSSCCPNTLFNTSYLEQQFFTLIGYLPTAPHTHHHPIPHLHPHTHTQCYMYVCQSVIQPIDLILPLSHSLSLSLSKSFFLNKSLTTDVTIMCAFDSLRLINNL